MAAVTHPARRVPVPASGDMNEVILEPGDYCGPVRGYTGSVPMVEFRLPVLIGERREGVRLDGIRHVVSPPHVFTEQPDGSLEIRESLGCLPKLPSGGYCWHGYLDAGNVWREV